MIKKLVQIQFSLFSQVNRQNFSNYNTLGYEFVTDNIEEINIIKRNYSGSLSHMLEVFRENKVNMTRIDTTLLNQEEGYQNCYFNISVQGKKTDQNIKDTVKALKQRYQHADFVDALDEVPWYPQNDEDCKLMGQNLLDVQDEVNKEHPQFKDLEYRKRRNVIADASKNHQFGDEIPVFDYLPQEVKTWNHIYNKVRPYHEAKFVKRFNDNFKKIEQKCGLSANNIPQLRDLNEFLQSETGFRIKPVHGILSQREFLNAFAHKIFCCTQYIRHHKTPEYTPEPDIIHEVLGHIPMFADPEFARMSQEVGLLSLGASDDQIASLGALYWYTVEFGSVKEDGVIKPYGAGIAGSYQECEHYFSQNAKFKLLNPFRNFDKNYPIQTVQHTYMYNESFDEAIQMLLGYGKKMQKPMKTYYDNLEKKVKTDRKIRAVPIKLDGPMF